MIFETITMSIKSNLDARECVSQKRHNERGLEKLMTNQSAEEASNTLNKINENYKNKIKKAHK